jgi:hypothetical protein
MDDVKLKGPSGIAKITRVVALSQWSFQHSEERTYILCCLDTAMFCVHHILLSVLSEIVHLGRVKLCSYY